MPNLQITFESETIAADPEAVWDIVGTNFDTIDVWASGVETSKSNPDAAIPKGAQVGGRICAAPGHGTLTETLTAYDAENMALTFTVESDEAPPFMQNFHMNWFVLATADGKSSVSGDVAADLVGEEGEAMHPMLTEQMRLMMVDLMADLKHYAETGGPRGR